MTADLIIFGEDWASHPSSTQHLIRHLPGDRRMMWVNSIGLRRPRIGLADLERAARKVGRAFSAPQAPTVTDMRVIQPLIIPMARGRMTRALNRSLLARNVGRAARDAGLRHPVLWTSLPSAVDAVGCLGESAVVYYCGDDFGALAGVDHDTALALEA